jgi:hypothetical protein
VTTVKIFWDIVKNLVKTLRYSYGRCDGGAARSGGGGGKYIILKTKKNVVLKVKVHE